MGRRILSRRRPGCKSRPGCPRPPALPTLLGRAASPSNSDGTASTSVRGGRARAYGRRAAPVATVPTGHSDGRSESSESESFSPAPLLVFTSVCSSACQADGSRRPRRRAMAPARGSTARARGAAGQGAAPWAPCAGAGRRPRLGGGGGREPRGAAAQGAAPWAPCAGAGRRPRPCGGGGREPWGPCALAREEGGGRTASREEGARRRLALVEAGAGRTVRCADRAALWAPAGERRPAWRGKQARAGRTGGEQTAPRAVGPGSSVRERKPAWRGGRTPARGEGRGERLIDTRPSFCVNSGGRSKRGQVFSILILRVRGCPLS